MKNFFIFIFVISSFNLYSQQKSDADKLNYYWGITLGLPNDFNLAASVESANFGLRLSGGAWFSGKYGAQLDLSYIFMHNKIFKHELTLIFGYSHNKKINNNGFFAYYDSSPTFYDKLNYSFYFGPAYSISWQGLLLQIGAVLGTGNFKKPKLISEIGYLFLL